MKLLAFNGALKLKSCCASTANAVREATLDDIRRWASDRGYEIVRKDRDP